MANESLAFGGLFGFIEQVAVADCNLNLCSNHFYQSYLACGPLPDAIGLTDRYVSPTFAVDEYRADDLREIHWLDLPDADSGGEIRIGACECLDVIDHERSSILQQITGYVVVRLRRDIAQRESRVAEM